MLELWFLIKVIFLTIFIIILRGTLPRYRIDFVLLDSWKEWIFLLLWFTFSAIMSYLFFLW